jgi:Protein kinase domain
MPADTRLASRYELKGRLGEGGMGIVYRAFDATTRSEVAIKTMRDVSDPAAVELFTKEWSVLAGMSHPNIVDVRDVGEFEQNGCRTPFFVMPLLGGTTLATLIGTKSPRLTPALIVEIVLQVCRGLQAAHERGLIHRDLKPSNIFVLNDDTAKIIDFGVVHFAGTHSISGHKGTWQYMAPEVSELKPATVASDIFSLGVICYEALTGRCPFLRRTAAETVEAIRTHTPPPVSDLNSLVPSALSVAVQKALAKSAALRFPSARDLAAALRRALPEEVEAQPDSTPTQSRMSSAQKAIASSRYDFALEILLELEAENPGDPAVAALRGDAEEGLRQSRIRQLIEASRTRLEHDEILLALEKLREVRQFAPDDVEVATLAGEIERRHQELIEIRLRPRKEALYESAMQALREGGVAEAIQRLESLLLMAGPVEPEWRGALQAALQASRNDERDQPADGFTPQGPGRGAFYEPSTAPRAAPRTADHTSFFPSEFLGDSVVSSPTPPSSVERPRPTRMAWIVAATVVPVVVLIGAIGVARLHTPASPPVQPAPVTDVDIATVPADAEVTIDGQLERNRHISLVPGRTYSVIVAKIGYLPVRRDELPHAHWRFTLAPEPLRVRIVTAAKEDGKVFLDGRIIGVLAKGVFSGFDFPADGSAHKIGVRTIKGDLFSAGFVARPGVRARVEPGETADLISIASLGSEATVYGGARERSIMQGSSVPQEIPDGGLELQGTSSQKNTSALKALNGEVFVIDSGNGPRLDFWLPERRVF